MAVSVYYFTRTGTCGRLANKIAQDKNVVANRIDDGKSWKGILGFINGGRYAAMKKTLPAAYKKPEQGDSIILVTPVWASDLPPGVRTFVDEVGRGRITLVASSMSSGIKDHEGYAKVIEATGKNPSVDVDG